MLIQLDAKNLPCYLNTQNEKNVSLYEHFGLRVIDQVTFPGSGILHTAMQRDPCRAKYSIFLFAVSWIRLQIDTAG
jgi:hypothetical protein